MLAGSRAPGAVTVLVLGLLTALGPLSIDLYLPAFPALRRDLAATDGTVQLTLAGMTVGLGLGQLVIGVWSDRVGRRAPLLLSTGLHVLATVGCALATSVAALAAFRVAQGIGAAGSSVLVLAMVRDLADGPALVALLSRVTLVTTAAPLVAPLAGAELLRFVGWRGIFWILAIGSAAVLVATAVLVPETRRHPSRPAYLLSRLRAVGSDSTFRMATLVASMTYASVYAYVAASPILLQEVYGLTVRGYAVVFLLNSLGLVAGVQLSTLLARKTRPSRVLAGFTLTTVLAAAAIVPLQQVHAGVAGLLACLWVFLAGCGGCFPYAEALALAHQGDQSGTASSVHGFTAFTVAGLVSPLAGIVGISNVSPVATVLLTTSAIALLSVGLLLRSIAGRERSAKSTEAPAEGTPGSGGFRR
jgi:MFS transporter, DHA1 family, multidrug resistance protein